MTTAELAEYLLSAEDVEELFARNREHHKAIDGQLLAELESRLILASRGQGKRHPGWICAVGVFASTVNRPAEVSYFLYFLTGQLLITAFEEEGMAGRTQELLENILSAQPELRQSYQVRKIRALLFHGLCRLGKIDWASESHQELDRCLSRTITASKNFND